MEKKTITLTFEEKQLLDKPWPGIRSPYSSMKLKPGAQYQYCTCGLSKTQPMCDGTSHEGTKFKPLTFKAKNVTYSLICGCRRNNPESGPYCDGSHSDPSVEW